MKRGIHPDNWFEAADFTPEGRTLVISKVEPQEIEPNRTKLVAFFKGETKGLVLNEVNQRIIAKNTGQDDTDDWNGFPVTLYQTSIKMRGEDTPCIRIKINVGTFSERESI